MGRNEREEERYQVLAGTEEAVGAFERGLIGGRGSVIWRKGRRELVEALSLS